MLGLRGPERPGGRSLAVCSVLGDIVERLWNRSRGERKRLAFEAGSVHDRGPTRNEQLTRLLPSPAGPKRGRRNQQHRPVEIDGIRVVERDHTIGQDIVPVGGQAADEVERVVPVLVGVADGRLAIAHDDGHGPELVELPQPGVQLLVPQPVEAARAHLTHLGEQPAEGAFGVRRPERLEHEIVSQRELPRSSRIQLAVVGEGEVPPRIGPRERMRVLLGRALRRAPDVAQEGRPAKTVPVTKHRGQAAITDRSRIPNHGCGEVVGRIPSEAPARTDDGPGAGLGLHEGDRRRRCDVEGHCDELSHDAWFPALCSSIVAIRGPGGSK